jgi:hypothetical protein
MSPTDRKEKVLSRCLRGSLGWMSSPWSLAVCAANASPDEVTLVEAALAASFLRERSEHLIADRAYDSDSLDAELAEKGIELNAPYRRN